MKKLFAFIKSLCNIVIKGRTMVLLEKENRELKRKLSENERLLEEKTNFPLIPEIFLESKRNGNLDITTDDKKRLNILYKEYPEAIGVIEKILLHERNINAAITADINSSEKDVVKAQSMIQAYSHLYRMIITAPSKLTKKN